MTMRTIISLVAGISLVADISLVAGLARAQTEPSAPAPQTTGAETGAPAGAAEIGFEDLLGYAGFEIDYVVEGWEPLPIYCVSIAPVEFATDAAEVEAAAKIDAYYRARGTAWYDLWSQAEWWMLSEVAALDEDASRYLGQFNLEIEDMDLHFLPVPEIGLSLMPIHDPNARNYTPPSEIATLIEDYGYRIVRMEEAYGLTGPEMEVLLRKTKLLTPAEQAAIEARIDRFLATHAAGWSLEYLWDRLFLNTLIAAEQAAMEAAALQDLSLHDIVLHVSWLPAVETRMRPIGKEIEGFPPPPC